MKILHIAVFRAACVLLALLALPAAQAREMRALVVAVSDYPNLDKDLWLDGPRNDAARVREVLLRRGFGAGRIAMLADGVADAGMPTPSSSTSPDRCPGTPVAPAAGGSGSSTRT